ncbi:hypothetical protein J6590_067488 [Homalodisca vitripennis]|nr:hypothetical protein J6590_067488 [Homalodisca vitripennis]
MRGQQWRLGHAPCPPTHPHHCLWTNGRAARPLPFALPSPPPRRMGVMAVRMAAPMNWREKLAEIYLGRYIVNLPTISSRHGSDGRERKECRPLRFHQSD